MRNYSSKYIGAITRLKSYDRMVIRTKPGAYAEFPIVDDKNGLFRAWFRCNEDTTAYELQAADDGEIICYGIYKHEDGIAYLINSFSNIDEVNVDGLNVIMAHFPYLPDKLGVSVKYTLMMNTEPPYNFEFYARVKKEFYLVSKISDINNISKLEKMNINKFPNAMISLNTLLSKNYAPTL
ncbi:UNVERIFIED_ORG: hypothetical protein LA328_05525 [Hafnia paralvei]|nr:hypothetical protein [Hafnia paralvei]